MSTGQVRGFLYAEKIFFLSPKPLLHQNASIESVALIMHVKYIGFLFRVFTAEELKPQPIIRKSKKVNVHGVFNSFIVNLPLFNFS